MAKRVSGARVSKGVTPVIEQKVNQKNPPFPKGSYFVWFRGAANWTKQVWTELNYGVNGRIMKEGLVIPGGIHQLDAQHLTMTLEELGREFPAPSFYQAD